MEYQFSAWTAFSPDTWNFHQTRTCHLSCLSSLASHYVTFSIMIKELLDLLHYYYNRFHDELWVNIHFSSRSKKERSWWFMYVFVWIDFQNVSASLFIAIKRQWCLECILKLEGFAKTKGFLLRSDLQINNHQYMLFPATKGTEKKHYQLFWVSWQEGENRNIMKIVIYCPIYKYFIPDPFFAWPWVVYVELYTGADTGFPVGGGANSWGAPTYKLARFSQKLHEIKKLWSWGGAHRGRPPWIRHWYSKV